MVALSIALINIAGGPDTVGRAGVSQLGAGVALSSTTRNDRHSPYCTVRDVNGADFPMTWPLAASASTSRVL
jgi:hypothetical protein